MTVASQKMLCNEGVAQATIRNFLIVGAGPRACPAINEYGQPQGVALTAKKGRWEMKNNKANVAIEIGMKGLGYGG